MAHAGQIPLANRVRSAQAVAVADPNISRLVSQEDDPYALKLYIDGNSYKNPGGRGGFACVAVYPEVMNRQPETVEQHGFHETTNNRMELLGCICALDFASQNAGTLGVQRAVIITDSRYVDEGCRSVDFWRRNGWRTAALRAIENRDLWKKFLTARSKLTCRVEIVRRKGKKTPVLKMVDRAAKDAGNTPIRRDRGFRSGKVGRPLTKGTASLFPASGQEVAIRIYRSGLIGKSHHKIFFETLRDDLVTVAGKYFAYADEHQINELHRHHTYRVKFGTDPAHPRIMEILPEYSPSEGEPFCT